MEENVSKYTNAIGSGKQAITQGQKRKGGRGMREGWEYKKLGDVCQVVTGSTPKTIISEYWDGNYPWVTPAELKGDVYISDTARHITEEAIAHTNLTLLPIGTVLLSSRAPIGKVAITTIEMYCNQGFKNLICSDAINNKYLYLWLSGKTEYLNSLGRGATFKEISKTIVENVIIPLPPLSIQKSIVTELDKINELIRLKKEQLKDYDNLAQSIFYEMFGDPVVNEKGWEVKKLGELSDLICNGNTPKGGSEVYVDTGFLFLRSQNVWKNRIELDDVAFIDEATHKSLKKSSLKHNDLLITKTGRINTENSSLGRTALFEGEDNSANINGHVYLVRLKDGMVHKFVLYILISNSYRELIRKTCVGGIDKRQLNKDHIEDFPIIFPPIELQKKYVERIELIEKQKEQVRSTIQDLDTLLASRMQYWFD